MPDTWDAWRHRRHYGTIKPLVAADLSASWLTIGDSGADAAWLRTQGVTRIIASSLTDTRLRTMRDDGILGDVDVRAIDAQDIALPDDAVDFCVCKEAYHHFERPWIAVYEMLRVSRKGIVLLCEPDGELGGPLLDKMKRQIKILLRRKTNLEHPEFEAEGNFIYSLSLTEMTKMATAIQIGPLLFSRLNDFWVPGLVYRKTSNFWAGFVIRSAILLQNIFSVTKLMSWGKLTIVLFKSYPGDKLMNELRAAGLHAVPIPKNPYI
jgi:SAM-dependent methyltransferase